MAKESEKERIQRLREQQINARDPGPSKIRHYDWDKHTKRRREIHKKKQKPLVVDLWDMLPGRYKGAMLGGVFGLIFVILANIWLTGEWVILGVLGMIIAIVIGFILGTTLSDKPEEK